jgi:Na+/H+ antiporter NhaC
MFSVSTFRVLLAHPQEALHKRRLVTIVYSCICGLVSGTTAHNSRQFCFRVEPPEDG